LLPSLVDGSRQAGVLPLGTTLVPWGDRITALVLVQYDDQAHRWWARRVDGGLARGDQPDAPRALAPVLDAGRRVVQLEAWKAGPELGAAADAAAAFDRGALGTAAQLVGLGRRMLDLTVAYVAERKQFGVPVGSQQAVKHHLADAALQLQFAAPALYRAAASMAAGSSDAHRDVSMAKALASDAARLVARQALQCHGAIGYTVEYDLHLYLKRAEALARSWGDASWHRGRVAWALQLTDPA
jgi:alkylation response protein AidB-like acyl-CoA dehydrogenase